MGAVLAEALSGPSCFLLCTCDHSHRPSSDIPKPAGQSPSWKMPLLPGVVVHLAFLSPLSMDAGVIIWPLLFSGGPGSPVLLALSMFTLQSHHGWNAVELLHCMDLCLVLFL